MRKDRLAQNESMNESVKLAGGVSRVALPVAEWFAENAYVAPGAHRLMTATGLMTGLIGGRYAMNILTGQNNAGKPTDVEDVPLPFRPFHGLYHYQRFDDSSAARWHQVVYDVVPAVLGGMGAMMGSSRYSSSTRFAKRFAADIAKGEFTLSQASFFSNMRQAKMANRHGAAGFSLGSSSGLSMFPGPFSTAWNAVRFQLDNGKKPMMSGLFGLFGNRGPRSRDLYTSMMEVVDWAESNAARHTGTNWFTHTPDIESHATAALQAVPSPTATHIEQMREFIIGIGRQLDARAAEIKAEAQNIGKSVEDIRALIKTDPACQKLTTDLSNVEKRYIEMGIIDPAHPERSGVLIGDNGIITDALRVMGGRKVIADVESLWQQSIKHRHGFGPAPTMPKGMTSYNDFTPKMLGYGAVGAAAFGGLAAIGSSEKPLALSAQEQEALSHLPRHAAAERYHAMQSARGFSLAHTLNGKPLDTLEWVGSVAAAAPNLHRFMNAAALSTFLYTGAKFSSALAGRGLLGNPVAEAEVWPIFKPIYGKMSYAWKSSLPLDRWKWAVHQLIPVAIGALGTYTGSQLYFRSKANSLSHPNTLEDATESILMHESESFAKTSAITSILNTGSGAHLIPFVSYGSNLNNRFMMANGQQVCSPVLGPWWSGNPSYYPEHVKGLLSRLVECAVISNSEYPLEFKPIAQALIAKLYPDLPADSLNNKVNALIDEMYAVRDPFWRDGDIADQTACREAMQRHFRGVGFEQTLQKIGLDPLQAALDHNGASGTVAKWLGAGAKVEADMASYHRQAAERMSQQPAPQTNSLVQALSLGRGLGEGQDLSTHSSAAIKR